LAATLQSPGRGIGQRRDATRASTQAPEWGVPYLLVLLALLFLVVLYFNSSFSGVLERIGGRFLTFDLPTQVLIVVLIPYVLFFLKQKALRTYCSFEVLFGLLLALRSLYSVNQESTALNFGPALLQ
jgi:hypothetical protein